MEDKVKFQLEYIINSSPRILFPFLVEPNGLSQWFADDVNYLENTYQFIWDDEVKKAKISTQKEFSMVKFEWVEDKPYYFEMQIIQDELTNEVAIAITDFAKQEDIENRKLIWNNSIDYLQRVIGA